MPANSSPDAADLLPASFARLASFITSELGIKMPDAKMTMIQSRLLRRVRDLGLRSVDEYSQYFFASQNDAEREHFINAVTTNKTDFFREPSHFDYLLGIALPELARGGELRPGRRLNVWSAGCSSGEEPYTLAMLLSEYGERQTGFDFAILATDVSTRVLDRARAGVYQESQIAPVPMELRRRHLWRSRNKGQSLVRIAPRTRGHVSFHRLNFMDQDYGLRQMFEVVFFRNVLIYFDRPTQEMVIRRMCRNLVPGGYLFVGHSESLSGLDLPVDSVHTSVFRRRA